MASPVIIASAMLIRVPITRYSVFISCRSFSLNRMIPFAATNSPMAEYCPYKTKIRMMVLSTIPIHFPALARFSASGNLSRHCLVSCPIKIPAGVVRKMNAVNFFQIAGSLFTCFYHIPFHKAEIGAGNQYE